MIVWNLVLVRPHLTGFLLASLFLSSSPSLGRHSFFFFAALRQSHLHMKAFSSPPSSLFPSLLSLSLYLYTKRRKRQQFRLPSSSASQTLRPSGPNWARMPRVCKRVSLNKASLAARSVPSKWPQIWHSGPKFSARLPPRLQALTLSPSSSSSSASSLFFSISKSRSE